jgi:ATP-dependent DNA helicase RecG
MTTQQLDKILSDLLALPAENEVVEFKEAKTGYAFNDIGQYFSALSNEANLKGKPCAWLVFGVNNKHKIVGSNFRTDRKSLDGLKTELGNRLTGKISFIEIYELDKPEGRVIMFQIPPAPQGIPIEFNGFYYARANESLVGLNIEKIDRIRNQASHKDWSSEIVANATIDVLDKTAIDQARKKFKEVKANSAFVDVVDTWDDVTFLDKIKVTSGGKITNTAILLLGKPESTHYISPMVAQITWKLDAEEQAYEHFETPFFLTVNHVLARIRNVNYKFFPDDKLVAVTVSKYDSEVILEALNNCIAHQDYSRRSRINLIEQTHKLTFENSGGFIDGTPDDYTFGTKMPKLYRNKWLLNAMVKLGMIDSLGYGIHKMNKSQMDRYFPLPDYSRSNQNEVILEIYGHPIDINYSKLLIDKKDELSLEEVIALDKVQKKQPLSTTEVERLRELKLVKGRSTSLEIVGNKSVVVQVRNAELKQMILDLLIEKGTATREDIEKLLTPLLPQDWTIDKQQKKISNIIMDMAGREAKIKNTSNSIKYPIWKINKS